MDGQTQFKGKGVLKWALTVGIVVVLNLFFAVGIDTVYPEPDYQDHCAPRQVNESYETRESCLAIGGQWSEYPTPQPKGELGGELIAGYCNPDFTCAQGYEEARKDYSRNIFVTLVVLGALSILGGFALRSYSAVSAGLSYGGVLTFIVAAIRYWEAAGDILRLGIVGLALVALVAIGIRVFKEQ